MRKRTKSIDKWQFGDFQTPDELATSALRVLAATVSRPPDEIIEPSCGAGAFIRAARLAFPDASIRGYEINPAHVQAARQSLDPGDRGREASVEKLDFFQGDWGSILDEGTGAVLITGNPPWVTSSELGLLNSANLPPKSNFVNARGIEAITGSSNFDISEFMLLQYVRWLEKRPGAIAVLCKTSVARKVFRRACDHWATGVSGAIYPIDAKQHFDASVDACFFVLEKSRGRFECSVYGDLASKYASYTIGVRGGVLVRHVDDYDDQEHLIGQDATYVWRSGLKHDCSRVMELRGSGGKLVNGMGERVNIEDTYRFPLLKSSDVANGRFHEGKSVIVPQSCVGEATSTIRQRAPATWRYLTEHEERLDGRISVVYRGKPRFSVFGVGACTFYPWKVAISGMYKQMSFLVVPPIDGKPAVFDDTVYFLSCVSRIEAVFVHGLLSSEDAQRLLGSLVFWDEKRPVTAKVLRSLDLEAVATSLGCHETYGFFADENRRIGAERAAAVSGTLAIG